MKMFGVIKPAPGEPEREVDVGWFFENMESHAFCESPIEYKFLYQFAMTAYADNCSVRIVPGDGDRWAYFLRDFDRWIYVYPQTCFGAGSRYDFFIQEEERTSHGSVWTRALIIEAAGKEYHSEPKDVAADKDRDLETLISEGVPTVRITGSKIHSHMYGGYSGCDVLRALRRMPWRVCVRQEDVRALQQEAVAEAAE